MGIGSRKILSLFFFVFFVLFSVVSCSKQKSLRFVTGGESGTYYAFGSVLAQHATNNAGVKVVGLVGAGSQSNVNEIQDGNAEFGFCQTDVMAYAYEGKRLFADKGPVRNFSVVAALYKEQVQIISVNPNIKSVADLKGKRVSVGASGSGVYFNALDVLEVYGLTESDIIPSYQSFGDSANDLKDGKIDAAFIVAGAPTTAVVDLSTTKKVNVISIDEEHVNKLISVSPYYAKDTISKSVYKTDSDVSTVSVGAVVLANDSVSDNDVYAFVKDMFSDPASQVSSHAKYAELGLDYASSITSVPYHKGAARFFAEKNKKVATK